MTDRVDALVIFGATGDLAKLETFPALVGLVDRGVLDVPVIGVAKSGWELGQFRAYAEASLRRNEIDPTCKAHELDNLYVVDTSFFPSIGAVNPSLTAIANALRVGDHIRARIS